MAFGITRQKFIHVPSIRDYMASAASKAHTADEKSQHVICLLMKRDQDDYIDEDASRLEPSDRAPGPTSW